MGLIKLLIEPHLSDLKKTYIKSCLRKISLEDIDLIFELITKYCQEWELFKHIASLLPQPESQKDHINISDLSLKNFFSESSLIASKINFCYGKHKDKIEKILSKLNILLATNKEKNKLEIAHLFLTISHEKKLNQSTASNFCMSLLNWDNNINLDQSVRGVYCLLQVNANHDMAHIFVKKVLESNLDIAEKLNFILQLLETKYYHQDWNNFLTNIFKKSFDDIFAEKFYFRRSRYTESVISMPIYAACLLLEINSQDVQAKEFLLKVLNSEDLPYEERLKAANFLLKINSQDVQAKEFLLKVLNSEDLPLEVLFSTATYLLLIINSQDVQAKEFLLKVLNSEDLPYEERLKAANYLRMFYLSNQEIEKFKEIEEIEKILTTEYSISEFGEDFFSKVTDTNILEQPDELSNKPALQKNKYEKLKEYKNKLLSDESELNQILAKQIIYIQPNDRETIYHLMNFLESNKKIDVYYITDDGYESYGHQEYEAIVAAEILLQADLSDFLEVIINRFKHNLNDKAKINDCSYIAFYRILWPFSQNMSYPEFYQAWHTQPGITHPEATDNISVGVTSTVSTLEKHMTDIASQLKPTLQVYPICIDGVGLVGETDHKAIAQEICTQIYFAVTPEAEIPDIDHPTKLKPKIISLKNTLKTEKIALIFYNFPPQETLIKFCLSQEPLIKFCQDYLLPGLSQFVYLGWVSDTPVQHPLRGFAPNQPNLVSVIQNWLEES